MTDDKLWGMLGVKKRTTGTQIMQVPAPATPAKSTIPSKSVSQPTPSPQPVAQPVTAPKPVKAKKQKKVAAQQTQQQSTQQPQYQLSDFRMRTVADSIGIHVITLYQGNPVHQFIMPVAQYANWQNSPPQAKYSYVRAQIPTNIFFNDLNLVNMAIQAVVNTLDNIFAQARAHKLRKGFD